MGAATRGGTQLGGLMAYAQDQAVRNHFAMDATYKARLARAIREELERGTHPADVKTALKSLIDRRLSPALLVRKVQDNLPKAPEKPLEATPLGDPFTPFPEY